MVRSKQLKDQIRAHGLSPAKRARIVGKRHPALFIRTVTVGFGIAPNLLTSPTTRRALAG